jgi:hypothetical protein
VARQLSLAEQEKISYWANKYVENARIYRAQLPQ